MARGRPPCRYLGAYLTCAVARGDTEVIIVMEPCTTDMYAYHQACYHELLQSQREQLSLMALEAVACAHASGMALRDIKVRVGGVPGVLDSARLSLRALALHGAAQSSSCRIGRSWIQRCSSHWQC